jgi:hypothetical protein
MTNWGTDDLTLFLETVHRNQQGNGQRFPIPYSLIQRVNDCFVLGGKHLTNPKPIMTGPLFLRSQYAYKTAVGMALAGQIVEAFVMLRSCLEYSGYALAIFATPTLEEVFLKRHFNADSMRTQKDKFKISNILKVIARFDKKLSQFFQILYDRTIDFGAHPNPSGTLNAIKLEKEEASMSYTTLALVTEELPLLHAFENTRQVGLLVLFIFQHIFKEKFELLGIREEMDALKGEQIKFDAYANQDAGPLTPAIFP